VTELSHRWLLEDWMIEFRTAELAGFAVQEEIASDQKPGCKTMAKIMR
jgi:hypothetical protein